MTAFTPAELLGPLNDVEQRHAPRRLFVAGDVDVLSAGPRVSVIGSRKASPQGLAAASELARWLVEHGIVVVSGLAEGIDTAAHEAAMENGGRTIAVLGTPLDRVFPARNHELQHRIVDEHLVISQFAPGTPVAKGNFPQRNRTMALISHASVIVEAGKSSGTQHQGWEAIRLGRPVFILDAVASDLRLEWPQKMIQYGAVSLDPADPWPIYDELPIGTGPLSIDALV